MTREEMAEMCIAITGIYEAEGYEEPMRKVAAELRKTCATCKHWAKNHLNPDWRVASNCFAKGMYHGNQPIDGSGFCHRWEAKP